MAKQIDFYNFRQAKADWLNKRGASPIDVIHKTLKETPGGFKRILESQRKQMFPQDGKE